MDTFFDVFLWLLPGVVFLIVGDIIMSVILYKRRKAKQDEEDEAIRYTAHYTGWGAAETEHIQRLERLFALMWQITVIEADLWGNEYPRDYSFDNPKISTVGRVTGSSRKLNIDFNLKSGSLRLYYRRPDKNLAEISLSLASDSAGADITLLTSFIRTIRDEKKASA